MDSNHAITEHQFILNLLTRNFEGVETSSNKLETTVLFNAIKNHKIGGAIGRHCLVLEDEKLKQKFLNQYREDKFYQLTIVKELAFVKEWFHGIDFLTLKGPVLSQFLYNDPAERNSWDLDLLIDAKDLDQCSKILIAQGYELLTKFKTPKQKAALIKHHHHFEFYHPKKGILIEIHWKLTDMKGFDTGINEVKSQSTKIVVGSNSYSILNPVALFEFLAIHGTFHLFSRYQWVYDLKTLYNSLNEDELAQIIEESKKHGSLRFVLVALNLLHDVFQTPLNPRIKHLIAKDSNVSKLTKFSQQELYFTTANVNRSGWKLMMHKHKIQYYASGMKGLIKSVFSRSVRPRNWEFFAFSDRVFFLNHVFSRVIWIVGKMVGKL